MCLLHNYRIGTASPQLAFKTLIATLALPANKAIVWLGTRATVIILERQSISGNAWPMLGKILLTLAVIITAVFYIRRRDLQEAESRGSASKSKPAGQNLKAAKKPAVEDNLSADLRLGAYMFLVLMIGLGAALYYFRWQDDHSILTVTLHGDNQAESSSYQVYKYQLQNRSFTTVDGILVTVASTERMEVTGLE